MSEESQIHLTLPKQVCQYIWNDGNVTFNLTTMPSRWIRFWVCMFFGGKWRVIKWRAINE